MWLDTRDCTAISNAEQQRVNNGNITPTEAHERLLELIQSFLDHPRHMGIKAPCGLGKTSCLVEALRRQFSYLDGIIEIYVPTIELAESIAELLCYSDVPRGRKEPNGLYYTGMTARVIRGRGKETKYGGKPMCQRATAAASLSSKGLSVYHNLCASDDGESKCPYYNTCPYICQFKEVVNVRIYTHASLPLRRGLLDRELPAFAVIDERFYSSLLRHTQLSIADLRDLDEYDSLGGVLEDALTGGFPLLQHLRTAYGDNFKRVIDEAIRDQSSGDMVIDPQMSDREQKRIIKSLPKCSTLLPMLTALKTEFATGRAESHALHYRDGKIFLHYREGMNRFVDRGRTVPILAIDADLNQDIHGVFFPVTEFHALAVERNCHVTQVYSSRFSKFSMTGGKDAKKRIRYIQRLINREAARGAILVVGPQALVGNPNKRVEPLVHIPGNCAFAHFGNIRGVDAYKDFHTIILIGRNQPSITSLEDAARALWYDNTSPLLLSNEWIKRTYGYRTRDGAAKATSVEIHPDPRVQVLLEQIRESESTQAIDRLRLIHCSEAKRVIILCNIPLDITVDCLVPWKDLVSGGTSLTQAWQRLDGVMPLNASYLHEEFPDLFPTIDGARWALRKNAIKTCVIPNIYPIRVYTCLAAYSYRIGGQKGRSSICLSEFGETETKADLETLLGEDVTLIEQIAMLERVDARMNQDTDTDSVDDFDQPEDYATPEARLTDFV
jgi:hypothetical protein